MSKATLLKSTNLLVIGVGAIALTIHAPSVVAQPSSEKDGRQSDAEIRRRLEPVLPSVRAALEGDNAEAQRAALSILADIPFTLAVDARIPAALNAFLQKEIKDPALLAQAIRAFGKTRPDPADISKQIGRYSRSEHLEVRQACAESVASAIENSTPSGRSLINAKYFLDVARVSLPLLGTLMGDKDPRTQRSAVGGVQTATRVLNELYVHDAGPSFDDPQPMERDERIAQRTAVVNELKAVAPKFAAPLGSKDADTRVAAATALESIAILRRTLIAGPAEAGPKTDAFATVWPALSPTLTERMHDENASVRLAVTQALESIGDALEARALLREATRDSSAYVRWTAARALGRTPAKADPTAVAADVAALAAIANDKDVDVRTASLTALPRFGTAAASAGPEVLKAARVGDVEPRVTAIKALDAIKTDATSTVPVLIEALEDKDLRLRRAAASGLVRFGAAAKAALPQLRQALLSTDADLRIAASEAILSIEKGPRLKEL
jgi:HEAT repeat protein